MQQSNILAVTTPVEGYFFDLSLGNCDSDGEIFGGWGDNKNKFP